MFAFFFFFFFFKQKTAYEIVSRDWSSDVCSSDLRVILPLAELHDDEEDAASSGETIVDLRCCCSFLLREERRGFSLETGISSNFVVI